MFTSKYFIEKKQVKELFNICGSFGEVYGELAQDDNKFICRSEVFEVECNTERDEYGVVCRQDYFTNKTNETIYLNSLKSRFIFDGGEYDVYTQFNSWQSESLGDWQPLVSSVSVGTESIRVCQNATPFMALWSKQEGRGTAFHLFANCAWEIKAKRIRNEGKCTKIIVDMGLADRNLNIAIEPGETIKSPKILCYEFRNKMHMDCYKLHNYMHTNYPRRSMPVIYNTWMCKFDHITYENISEQIPLAAEIGAEYFCIDAGWFGDGTDWSTSVGDWVENKKSALCGKMLDISNEVQSAGMKFGLWMEPERANINSISVKEHPEFYLSGCTTGDDLFFDFSNDEALKWMQSVIFNLIDKYKIEYIKDDFNADLFFDINQSAFMKYHEGYARFIKSIRDRYPDIYLTSCSAGGDRLELHKHTLFDSTWPSDNENPYAEMNIYKHTILRLPPQYFERWVAVHSIKGLDDFYNNFTGYSDNNTGERLVACGDAIWNHLVGINYSYLKGYTTCAPIGISSDLRLLSETAKEKLAEIISQMKERREFFKTAVARIIADTETITAYEYSDMALSKIIVQVITNESIQNTFLVHPEVDITKNYRINNSEIVSGKEIDENGLRMEFNPWNDIFRSMFEFVLEEC